MSAKPLPIPWNPCSCLRWYRNRISSVRGEIHAFILWRESSVTCIEKFDFVVGRWAAERGGCAVGPRPVRMRSEYRSVVTAAECCAWRRLLSDTRRWSTWVAESRRVGATAAAVTSQLAGDNQWSAATDWRSRERNTNVPTIYSEYHSNAFADWALLAFVAD